MKNITFCKRIVYSYAFFDHYGILSDFNDTKLILEYVRLNGKAAELRPTEYYGLVVKSDSSSFIQLFNQHNVDPIKIDNIRDIPAECYILPLEDDTKLYSVVIKKTMLFNKESGNNDHIVIYVTDFTRLMKEFINNEIITVRILKWGQCK